MEYFVLVFLGLAIGYLVFSDGKERTLLKGRVNELESLVKKNVSERDSLVEELNDLQSEIIEERQVFSERAKLFPWLQKAFSDLEELRGRKASGYIYVRGRRAYKSIDIVNEYKRSFRELEKRYRHLSYRLYAVEGMFPWVSEMLDDSLEDYLEKFVTEAEEKNIPELSGVHDPILKFIGPEDFARLSSAERSELALKRWAQQKKTNWQVGAEYERFVGYHFEEQGYSVSYIGIEKGLEDLGRDLIAVRGDTTLIVQCKYWSSHKHIREKHIMQLYATAVEYALTNQEASLNLPLFKNSFDLNKIKPVFVTSTKLSERARHFAEALSVEILEDFLLRPYPMIKCKKSEIRDTMIYHLPFDQQYDKVKINKFNRLLK
ncbi:MAG: restriction endonuclease [Natronohydrobacter sp.]|nr:restriction endonuclease [Natronohydrobacter sp.]